VFVVSMNATSRHRPPVQGAAWTNTRRTHMGTYPHGLFTWTDVSLPDPVGGSKFYSELFGWEAADQHDPEGNYIYTMFTKDGETVAGLGKQPEAMQNQGIPPMWNSYITVDDLDEALAEVEANGGSVLVPAMDVMAAGRMALIGDPTGAPVALWQEGDHAGAGAFNRHGHMTWNELATRDTQAARDFYAAVLGWSYEPLPGAPSEYHLITVSDKPEDHATLAKDNYNGGIMAMDDTWPADMPAHWMVYFQVDDTDAAAERLTELGGSVSVPPFDSSAGRIAVVADPQGGTFSIIAPPEAAA
jgi:predicted enzyme related to lactoylglutathione lyase